MVFSSDNLDSRKQTILRAIVDDYVRTAEPVGSQSIAERGALGVKSATVRSEMAELSEMGYIIQPHTSAGRIPTDLGYRFFVDWLMAPAVSVRQTRLPAPRSEVDILVEETCKLLSRITHYTSVATSPAISDAVITHASVSRLGVQRLLLVVMLDNTRIMNHILDLGDTAKADVALLARLLVQRLSGKSLQSIAQNGLMEDENEPEWLARALNEVAVFIGDELEISTETDVHFDGASYIAQQPEFRDVQRLEKVLSALERRRSLHKLFASVYVWPSVTVIIGSENPLDDMRHCSVVATKYRVGSKVAGTIGVVGPTRMDYRKAVDSVSQVASGLGRLLTSLNPL